MTTVLANNIRQLRRQLGLNQAEFAERVHGKQPNVSKWEAGTFVPSGDSLAAMAQFAGCSYEQFKSQPLPDSPPARPLPEEPPSSSDEPDPIDMVGVAMIDISYGLGTTFAVDKPEVEVLQFPKEWIKRITYSPPAMLVWTTGKGDSMEPTIRDGDMVLLDRSQRTLTERDAMWAFTIGEEAAIKRLRRQGDRCQILSDNASVPVDEQNLRDMNIVGRVVFVGSRK